MSFVTPTSSYDLSVQVRERWSFARCHVGHHVYIPLAVGAIFCPACSPGAYSHLKPQLEDLPCKHCAQSVVEHAEGWCLYSPTQFTPITQEYLDERLKDLNTHGWRVY